jgi:hypothetical protein
VHPTRQIRYVKALDSTASDGSGKTGLTFGNFTAGYIPQDGTPQALITETIPTLGSYQPPTDETFVRIKEVSNVDPYKGLYEVHFHDAQLASSERLWLCLSAAGAKIDPLEIDLRNDVTHIGGVLQTRADLGLATALIEKYVSSLFSPSIRNLIFDRILAGNHDVAGTPGRLLQYLAANIESGFNDETVPPLRTWKLKPSPSLGVLVGEDVKGLTVGDDPTFAVDFAVDLPTNGQVRTVPAPTIYSGTAGGITFGTPGREDSQAKIRITGVTAGTYVIQFKNVLYDTGARRTARVTLKVSN